MKEKNNNPIGIFDSGMGGLTVLKAIRNRLPDENIVYFGDTAHLPYGNKSPESIIKYSFAISNFFIKKNIKLMVVACNTASVYSLKMLKDKMEFPVIGVVESGVNAALKTAKNSIGIIGTYGTIKSKVYEKQIISRNPDIKIYSRHCPLFVPLIEEGWIDHPVTKEVAKIYLYDLNNKVESLILACTHYPLIKKVISRVMEEKVCVIDSAEEVAKVVERKNNEFSIANTIMKDQNTEFYVSDAPEIFMEKGELFLGHKIEEVQLVEID